jgi:hypothetical protein
MKPARIQVFDGLRVATEHIDHLQDGFQSSIDDLRAVLGLGRVLYGLEVHRQGESGIEVQPGFAFDRHRNRVVVDEPQQIQVTFANGQNRRYVCARYERVEDGEVEGRPTLVWDSASVLVNDTLPTAEDDVVPLAVLVRGEDGNGFEVVSVAEDVGEAPPSPDEFAGEAPQPGSDGEPPTSAEEPPTEAGVSAPAEPESEPPAPAGEVEAPTPAPAEPAAEAPTSVAESPAPTEPAAGVPPAGSTNGQSLVTVSPRLRQGVLDLSPGGPEIAGLTALTEALRGRLREGGQGDIRVVLGSGELLPGFAVSGLTGETTLSGEVQSTARPAWRAWASAHGEATFGESAVAQFGLSTVYSRWAADSNGTSPTWRAPELHDASLARLPLWIGEKAEPDDRLVLRLEVVPGSPGLTLTCALVWSGDVDEERVRALASETTGLFWSAHIGWKVVGA